MTATLKHTFNDVVDTCNRVYSIIPTLSGAYCELNESQLCVDTYWSQVDVERNERIKYSKTYLYYVDQQQELKLVHKGKATTSRQENVAQEKTRDGSLTAIISEWKDKNGGSSESKQFLEIWNNDARMVNRNLSKEDKHGKYYENTLKWSSNGNILAYIAETKRANTQTCLATAQAKDELNAENYLNKYSNVYVDTWGEQTNGKSDSTLVLYSMQTSELKLVQTNIADICPLNLAWYKDEGIVFTAYYTKPYRLGYIYCPIRKSDLFYYDLKQETCVNLTQSDEEHNVRSPVFSNDYTKLSYLENTTMGAHFKCSKLMIMDWATRSTSTLIDIVNEQPKDGKQFAGVYSTNINLNCWSKDNKRIVFNTVCNHKSRVVCVHVETGKVTMLTDQNISDVNYLECLYFGNDWLLALSQGYNRKPQLAIAHLPSVSNEENLKWTIVRDNDDGCGGDDDDLDKYARVNILKHEPNVLNQQYPDLYYESILVEPNEDKIQRNNVLVVFPHGGPHSAFACEYSSHVTILYMLGYSILLVNYRGSIGFGQHSIDSLPGNVGVQDVQDVQQAAEYCMKTYSFKNAVLYGGSHGGFLSTHLIGQYPLFYSSAVVRNPVTSLETNRANTDIPDWAFTEALGNLHFDYNLTASGNESISVEIYKRSPIYYINQVQTPLLFLIGGADLRVPPAQSIEYYKALLQRKRETQLIWFKDDNHGLDRSQTTSDSIINAVLWFEKYLRD